MLFIFTLTYSSKNLSVGTKKHFIVFLVLYERRDGIVNNKSKFRYGTCFWIRNYRFHFAFFIEQYDISYYAVNGLEVTETLVTCSDVRLLITNVQTCSLTDVVSKF